ncbi:hypothetical protein T492DRAFT_887547 [Pavlovales sp. CCMP2436]|nr:hypothetical protein T492DRAFT_887547 [Pavlovales sp. CCMP2436]
MGSGPSREALGQGQTAPGRARSRQYEMQLREESLSPVDEEVALPGDDAPPSPRSFARREQRSRLADRLAYCAVAITLAGSAAAWSWSAASARQRDAAFGSLLAQIQGHVNASSRALDEIAAVAAGASAAAAFVNLDGAQPGSSPREEQNPGTAKARKGDPPKGADGEKIEGEGEGEDKSEGGKHGGEYSGCFSKGQLLELNAAPGEGGGWSVLRNYSHDAIYIAVPLEQLSRPFTVVGTAGRVSGLEAAVLHYGVGVDDSLFHLRVHPHKVCC